MPPDETTFTGKFFEEMRLLMEATFSLDDLRTLCSDREIVYDNITGDTLTAKARGIIDECKRTRTLADLVDYCRKHRPKESWPDPPHGVKVAAAFAALGEMLEQDGTLRDAVTRFKHSFEGANARIDVVTFYKSLHDQLHILQVKCYDPLVSELKRAEEFKGTYESILKYVQDFKTIVDKLKVINSQLTIATYDSRWITKLGQSQMLMAIGADPQSFDLAQVKAAAEATNNILSVHPANINGRLMGSVDALNLQSLRDAMGNVASQFARFNLNQERVEEFKTGIDSLDRLNQRLIKLAMEHNPWQDADRVLRRIDEQMELGISELERSWPDLQSDVMSIFGNSDEEWAVRMKLQSDKLDAALKEEPKDIPKITQSFDNYRQQAIQRFFNVDTFLLNLCAELGEMGKRLTPLLEKM